MLEKLLLTRWTALIDLKLWKALTVILCDYKIAVTEVTLNNSTSFRHAKGKTRGRLLS